MTAYPLLFSYRDLITCRGFFAYVKADGRALLEVEGTGHRLRAVYPGSIEGDGDSCAEAQRALKTRYLAELFDIAERAVDFDAFKSLTEEFFLRGNDAVKSAWSAAHIEVRRGNRNYEHLPKVEASTLPVNIDVMLVRSEDAQPSRFNRFDGVSEAA